MAGQVGATPGDLVDYTTRTKTRYDHVETIEQFLGFRRSDQGDLKALGDWLVERAMEHDRPIVLFRLACEHLRAERIVRPGVTTIERAVIAARHRATDETYLRIGSQVDGWREELDALLEIEPERDRTPLVWLRGQGPEPAAASIKEQLAKIERLRAVGADQIDLSSLNPNRVRHLLGIGRRLTPQALARLEPARRHQILAAAAVELLIERIDDVLGLFDAAVGGIDGDARRAHGARNAANTGVATETVKLFTAIACVILDPDVPDSQVRSTILDRIGTTRFESAVDAAISIAVPETGHLDLVCARYSRVRQFAHHVLAAFDFQSASPNDPLLEAVELLKELNRSGGRVVPDGAPTGFAFGWLGEHECEP